MNEKQIDLYVRKLGISREEAIALIADEEADNLPELTPEQRKIEKEMRKADRKIETAPRKRERKPDENKRLLINALMDCLLEADPNEMENVSILNPEREIEFTFKGEHYRLTLAKPRKEK